ncbi:trinucleotide repeat-containing gene 6B protein isoform X2 [Hippocampus zosterae]|uniref:trinucleotide repeat-containing gene 6B protein isoform X2 n=1 Tax=Hippocampus zosterae TaxID=109293 RepID=UPI00223D8178|nr:trinucleotide repeat-containing gene 6B protein isoform X2 [Hippocampus zosterae]
MEDKKRKKEEKRKREASQKVTEQKNKVLDLTKQSSAHPPATQSSSASPSPGPSPSASPSPATSGPGSAAAQSQGGNNAKRLAVANGQPTSTSSSSSATGSTSVTGNGNTSSGGAAQAPQQQPRYMPREVPPRFRCQQDHKVLLKRGQPPLSSMLLGGGGGGGGDPPNANTAAVSDSGAATTSLALTSSSVAASTTTSNYANSMWGTSLGSQASSQGREKVIVDGNDLEEWPSIAGSDGGGASFTVAGGGGGGSSSSNSNGMPVNSTSASGNQSSSTSLFSLPNECMQSSSSVAWGTAAAQGHLGGGNAVASAGPILQQSSSVSKAAAVPGSHDASGLVDGSSGIPGANFNPNANPSAWPALVQQDEGGPSSFHHQGPGGTLSANNSASVGLKAGAVALGGHQALSVNQSSTHQHQLHQMQSRDREMAGGKWDSESAGPKIAGEEGVAGGMGGGGDHNLCSSWRGQPSYPVSNSKTGASRTDGWEGREGGTGSYRAAEGDNGSSGWGYPGPSSGVKSWGSAGNGANDSQTGVSQGGWGTSGAGVEKGMSSVDWGGSSSSTGGAHPGEVRGGACSSNSSSSGCSTAGNPPVTSTAMNRAWDNQKGEGETGEWGEGGHGAQGGSLSSGGNSRCEREHNGSRPRRQPPDTEAALQNLLSRPDLDPRVLSNTGWGQTQIRQNTAWDLGNQAEHNKSALSSTSSKHPASLGHSSQYSSGPRIPIGDSNGPGVHPPLLSSAGSSAEGWETSSSSSSSGGASLTGRAPQPSGPTMSNLGVSQSGAVIAAGTGSSGPFGQNEQGKTTGLGAGGMGAVDSQETKGWDNEEWRTNRGNGGSWGGLGEQGNPVSAERGAVGWKEMGGEGRGSGWGSGQKVGAGRDWGEQESKSNSSGAGWEDEPKNGGRNSGAGSWGSWGEDHRRSWGAGGPGAGGSGAVAVSGPKPHQGWSGGNKMHQMPNSQSGSITGLQAQLQQQQSQPRNQPPQLQQALDQGAMQGGGGRKPISQAQNQSSGWTSGPMPAGHGGSGSAPSGWEEPSPQSLSRKNEIDDGTSAWGDPTHYNYKPVNLWDKNTTPAGRQPHGQSQAQQQGPPPSTQQLNRPATGPGGGRDFNTSHGLGKASPMGTSGWGGTPPASPTVDNGTAAWGKPTDAPSGWGEPDDAGGKSGWGNPPSNPINSGSKSMQDSWGEKEGSVTASRHSSWEEEEEGGSMWNSAGSQGSGSSWGQGSNGGWGQSHNVKKPSHKGPLKVGGDSWMSPINRQFSNMGLLNDDPSGLNIDLPPGALQEKKMEMDKRALGMMDYNGDMRKGRGGGSMAYRSPVSKEAAPGDGVSFYDKTLLLNNQDGYLGEDGPCSLFSPPTAYKPHSLFNHTIPFRQGGHGLLGSSGGMSQPRHQPNVPTMNQSQGIRAQVPHQFLSPQVPGSMLKQMPPPSGGIGGVGSVGGVPGVGGSGVFPPQLSPQHIAMLSSIYPPHIQFQLACQLLLQQQQQPPQQQLLQNQRKFTPNVRQQADPQQLARIMAVLQQQRQQQQVGGLGGNLKLSPSHHGGSGAKLHGVDSLPHQGLAGSVADLHQKTFGPYSGMDLGGSMVGGPGGMKDMGGQQSRFKWMMEGHSSPDTSSPENAFHKNGPVTSMKMPGGSPYSQYDMIVGDAQGNTGWHRTPGKMSTKPTTTASWPPEFQPGVPWKGIDRVDPESDPYMTPGSMMGNTVSPCLNDTEHQLLQDNTDSIPPLNTLLPSPGAWPYSASDPLNNAHNSAKYTDYKTGWPPEPIGHKSWKASRGSSQAQLSRPPPGLASQKQISPTPWSGGGPRLAGRGWSSGSGTSGSAWSDSSSRESCWLVLSNLTPQIDGSTLRTICMQHGPLLTFHLGLTQGSALIRYGSKQEAAKAQSALHMCVLGNTTILAEFVSEEDVAQYIAHSQAGGSASGGAGTGSGATPAPSSAVGANGSGANCELAASAATAAGGGGNGGGGTGGSGEVGSSAGTVVPVGAGHSESTWQSLEATGSSSDQSAPAAPGLGIFSQWSGNGAGVGGGGGVEAGRQGLWGGMSGMSGAGYPSSSLWGSPALEDRHQMGSPASLLPGDLLGGNGDSI